MCLKTFDIRPVEKDVSQNVRQKIVKDVERKLHNILNFYCFNHVKKFFNGLKKN
jgi:hypothetical protein